MPMQGTKATTLPQKMFFTTKWNFLETLIEIKPVVIGDKGG